MQTKPPGPKRDHHYVPQHYLKGFTESPNSKFLWVYRRGASFDRKRNPCRRSIKNTGSIRDLYAVPSMDGRTTADYEHYENLLERQEQIGVEVLSLFRAKQPVDLKAKAALSFYLDLMLKRVPTRARHVVPILASALERYPWESLATLAAEEGRFDMALRLTRDREETTRILEKRLLLASMARRSREIGKALASMTWLLFVAPRGQVFVTSDTPAFFPRSIGLGKEGENGSFLVFPISSSVALFACRVPGQDLTYIEATEAQMDLLNGLTLHGADQFVYANAALPEIVDAWQRPFRAVVERSEPAAVEGTEVTDSLTKQPNTRKVNP